MATIRPHIVLFGDSHTEFSMTVEKAGWGASLANYFSRKADVVVRGFAGYNSRCADFLLDKVFPIPSSDPPLLVTVWFGANDAADPNAFHGVLHVPPEEYKENLHKIIAHLQKRSESTKIILITPGPIHEEKLLQDAVTTGDTSGVPTRTNDFTKLYVKECLEVGKEKGLPVIDLWSVFQEAPDWQEKYLIDGLHMTAEGNAKVYEELLKALDDAALAPTLKADQMPPDFPFIQLSGNPIALLKSWSPRIQIK